MTACRQSPQQQLERYLKPWRQAGRWTHDYAGCGSFRQGLVYETSHGGQSTWFDLASLSKAIVTAPLIHTIQSEAEPILPAELQFLDLTRPGLLRLISHRSGFRDWVALWIQDATEAFEPMWGLCKTRLPQFLQLCRQRGYLPSVDQVGPVYSDLGYLAAGFYLEYRYDRSLWELFQSFARKEKLCIEGLRPHFVVQAPLCAPTGFCALRKRVLCGEIHDENASFIGGLPGHTGMFGTGRGLVAWLESFYRSPAGRAFFASNQVLMKDPLDEPDTGLYQLCGLDQAGPASTGAFFGQGKALGHVGFTGGAFWVDMQRHKYAVFLTNRTFSGRRGHWFHEVRRRVFDLLGQICGCSSVDKTGSA
ncbi:MAG: serine hydrolase [Zetaproteobacteria bacterium]|nr:serine hydrolase [Zetaproteobacteria bacterium]